MIAARIGVTLQADFDDQSIPGHGGVIARTHLAQKFSVGERRGAFRVTAVRRHERKHRGQAAIHDARLNRPKQVVRGGHFRGANLAFVGRGPVDRLPCCERTRYVLPVQDLEIVRVRIRKRDGHHGAIGRRGFTAHALRQRRILPVHAIRRRDCRRRRGGRQIEASGHYTSWFRFSLASVTL